MALLVVTQLALQSIKSLAIAEDTAGSSKPLRGGEHQDKVSVAQCVCPPLRFVELEGVSYPHAHGIRAYIPTNKAGRKRFAANGCLHKGD